MPAHTPPRKLYNEVKPMMEEPGGRPEGGTGRRGEGGGGRHPNQPHRPDMELPWEITMGIPNGKHKTQKTMKRK